MSDLQDKLNQEFPRTDSSREISWTKQGSSEGLKEKLYSLVDNIAQLNSPATGLILFEKLPDGGYEIIYYQKEK